jgi:hypothetical protein
MMMMMNEEDSVELLEGETNVLKKTYLSAMLFTIRA